MPPDYLDSFEFRIAPFDWMNGAVRISEKVIRNPLRFSPSSNRNAEKFCFRSGIFATRHPCIVAAADLDEGAGTR
jgi:hypothetical protein